MRRPSRFPAATTPIQLHGKGEGRRKDTERVMMGDIEYIGATLSSTVVCFLPLRLHMAVCTATIVSLNFCEQRTAGPDQRANGRLPCNAEFVSACSCALMEFSPSLLYVRRFRVRGSDTLSSRFPFMSCSRYIEWNFFQK